MRTCRKCGRSYPADRYHFPMSGGDYLTRTCRKCYNAAKLAHTRKDKLCPGCGRPMKDAVPGRHYCSRLCWNIARWQAAAWKAVGV